MECHKTEDGRVIAIFSQKEMKMLRIAIGETNYPKFQREGIETIEVDFFFQELVDWTKENGYN